MTQMPMGLTDDEDARRQIREELGATLLVEAGAGTGKTSALVDRVVALVLNGTAIEKIAAITFTEKAATELRDRVRAGLEDELTRTPEKSRVVQAALESLERAQLSTIHAFAQTLLRGFAAHAGIDPSFSVSDEVKAERRFQERWRLYLDALSTDVEASLVLQRALGLGMTPADMETLARRLAARAELVDLLNARPLRVPTPFWPNIDERCRELDELRIADAPEGDALRAKVDRLIGLLSDLQSAEREDREAILGSGASLLETKFGVSRADLWGGRIDEVRTTAADICVELKELLSSCRREVLAQLMPLIVRFVEGEAISRGREGELTFDDLILRARDLLQSDEGVARSLRDRYDALLIDEFQDTDPLQVDIALSFAYVPGARVLEPGRLFLVGDPKQSIYRFRHADMGVYSRTRELVMREGGDFPLLSRNRRSRPQILEWVNSVFAQMMGIGERPEVQPPYRSIVEDRGQALRGPGVAYFGGQAGENHNAREVRQMEAADAAAICMAVVEQRWEVWDRVAENARPAQYRDVALLMPSRNVLTALERALADAGVPYRVEGGSLVYRTQEVRDLMNCLAAIDDPADEVAVVGALRSPAFACSDVDLARHRSGGGRFDYSRPDAEAAGEPRVLAGLAVLTRFHEERHKGSIAALIERFVADRAMVEVGTLDRGDRNSFRRMRFVVEQARVFESSGTESLREFVAWLESRSARDLLDNEGAGLDDDEDAVRLLTVHGAKGLEFPIVLMVGMGTTPILRPDNYLADHSTAEVAVWVGTETGNRQFTLGPCEELKAREKAHVEAEFVRLLYVAATRARDHLLFSLHHSSRAKSSAAAQLQAAGAAERTERMVAGAPPAGDGFEPLSGLRVDEPAATTVEAFDAARDALVAGARRRLFTSATAEVRETAQMGSEKEDEGDAGEPWARGRGGTRLGRAVHAAIQSLPLDAGDSTVEAFSRAQAVAEAIPDREGEVARTVRRALDSDAAERARNAERALKEVPFAVQSGDVTLEGFIDLVIQTPEGLEVVDWKTDQIGDAEVEARLVDYRLQAGLYVWGLQEATGMRVHRVTYVFASAGREVSPGEPGALAEAARRHLSARTGSASR